MEAMRRIGAKVAVAGLLTVAGLAVPAVAWAEDTEVQASNSCEDCDVTTGDSSAQNSSTTTTGQQAGPFGSNYQEGDNSTDVEQKANSSSGDAVAGQAIGVAGGNGNVRVIANNRNENVNVTTGNANAANLLFAFTGQLAGPFGANVQIGDNDTEASQTASASSGDGVTGQVIGIV